MAGQYPYCPLEETFCTTAFRGQYARLPLWFDHDAQEQQVNADRAMDVLDESCFQPIGTFLSSTPNRSQAAGMAAPSLRVSGKDGAFPPSPQSRKTTKRGQQQVKAVVNEQQSRLDSDNRQHSTSRPQLRSVSSRVQKPKPQTCGLEDIKFSSNVAVVLEGVNGSVSRQHRLPCFA